VVSASLLLVRYTQLWTRENMLWKLRGPPNQHTSQQSFFRAQALSCTWCNMQFKKFSVTLESHRPAA